MIHKVNRTIWGRRIGSQKTKPLHKAPSNRDETASTKLGFAVVYVLCSLVSQWLTATIESHLQGK